MVSGLLTSPILGRITATASSQLLLFGSEFLVSNTKIISFFVNKHFPCIDVLRLAGIVCENRRKLTLYFGKVSIAAS